MFIAIYEDGESISKTKPEDAFSLPGCYYVFRIGSKNTVLNDPDGICFYNSLDEIGQFKIKNLELIDTKGYSNEFQFSIYDYNIDKAKNISIPIKYTNVAIVKIVAYILAASEFANIEIYQEFKETENYKKENILLKDEITQLKEEILKLKSKFS